MKHHLLHRSYLGIVCGCALALPACGGPDASDGTAQTVSDVAALRRPHRDGGTVANDAGGGSPPPPNSTDLCAGLVQDKNAHPMTALAKPAVGKVVTDPQFGTKIRRITAASGGSNPAIVPLYSTVSAWNADESKLMLYNVETGNQELYDGKTYAFIRALTDISPPDVEQVFWHTTDPDIFFYVEDKSFIRYHVSTKTKETLTTFSFCSTGASSGSDPMFTSFDSKRIGLGCGTTFFVYDISTNTVIGKQTISNDNPPQMSPSGKYTYLDNTGRVTDTSLNVLRTLDLREPYGHASLGWSGTGDEVWNGQAFDPGPNGDDDIGNLVSFSLTTGKSKTVIGPKTGWPYPPDGHVSSLAYKNPGWVFVSTFGNTDGQHTLDMENLVANVATGVVCRIGRHRSRGKNNTKLAEPYWAEAHTAPSPSGTRAVFASDWGNGATVDTYVVELPTYK